MSSYGSDITCPTGTVPDGFGNCYPCSICTVLSRPPSGCDLCDLTTIKNDVKTVGEAASILVFGVDGYTTPSSKVQERTVTLADGQYVWLAALCTLVVLTTLVIAVMIKVHRNQRYLSRLSGRLIAEGQSLYGDDEEKRLIQTWVDLNSDDNTTKTRTSNDISRSARDHTNTGGQLQSRDGQLSGNGSRYGDSSVDEGHDSC